VRPRHTQPAPHDGHGPYALPVSERETSADSTDWEAAYAGEMPDTPVDADVMALARTLEAGTALDLGCASGQNSVWLAQQGWNVHGLDIASGAIKRANQAAKHAGIGGEATFERADLTIWRTKERFDLVISTYALPPRGPGRIHALATTHEAVAPNGRALVTEFDATLADTGWMPAKDLVTLDEIAEAFSGFDLECAAVRTTPHTHGDETNELPVVIVIARHSGPQPKEP
jgi:SAM-dependent methyltransferase